MVYSEINSILYHIKTDKKTDNYVLSKELPSMYKRTLGEVLKKLRTDNKYTQAYLSQETGYSEKQLRRIEQGTSIPNIDLLYHLSIIYNQDLFDFYKKSMETCVNGSKEAHEIKRLIKSGDYQGASDKIASYKHLDYFKSGEGLQLVYYIDASIQFIKHQNYTKTKELCMNGLLVSYPDFTLSQIHYRHFTLTSFNLISLLAVTYYYINEKELCHNIHLDLLINIESNYIQTGHVALFNDKIHKKVYLMTLLSLINFYLEEANYEKAMNTIKQAINFTKKNQCLSLACEIYRQKFRLHIILQETKEAIDSLHKAVFLANLTKHPSSISKLKTLLSTQASHLGLDIIYDNLNATIINKPPCSDTE